MSARKQINESLSSIILFLRLFKNFQIGELLKICHKLDEQPTLYDQKVFAKMLAQFIYHVNQQNKKNHTQNQYLAIMITQSLIYNLYRINNKSQINNSIYGNSLMISSSSQIGFGVNDISNQSIKHYQSIQDHFSTNFSTFLLDFIGDSQLVKKLKQMIQRSGRKAGQGVNLVQKYLDILLDTIQYILNKEGKLDKNSGFQFESIKNSIGSNNSINNHFEKKNLKSIISEVNKIIFSSKLNRIVFLLQQAEQRLYLSLIRIYLAQNSEQQGIKGKAAKYFSGISHSGDQMLFNLTWAYVQSIPNKNKLFQASKNPLFRLIQARLLCLYMFVFRSFHQVVGKCCKFDFSDGNQFYKVCQTTINKDLCQFINEIPVQLSEYLRLIYRIVLTCEIKSSNKKQIGLNVSSIALTGVKKLLVYSLLANPKMIETYYSQGVDLQKYEQVCNYIINLFFRSSGKRNQGGSSEAQIIVGLTKSVNNALDQKILGGQLNTATQQNIYQDDFQKPDGLKNYVIQQPILNFDYQVLWQSIRNKQFTPKDLRQFEMHKKEDIFQRLDIINLMPTENVSNNSNNFIPILNNISPRQNWSPMNRVVKKDSLEFNESIQYLDNIGDEVQSSQKQQIDFLTWMTVGGTRDYRNLNSLNSTSNTKKQRQKTEFITFPKQKIKQISKLYQAYSRITL